MIVIYVSFIFFGVFCYYMLELKNKSLASKRRKIIDRDYWDLLFWKIGIGIGVCGMIGIVIELLKLILNL